MNKAYLDLILNRVQAAVEAASAIGYINNKGIKGQLREVVIRDLFRPLLPADVGVGTGEVISAKNQQSKQQDILLYDKRILPPILFEEHSGIFPIESVLYAIEVKSILTAGEIRESHQSAAELKEFDYMTGEYDEQSRPIIHNVRKLISAILAFDTDLAPGGKSELERYEEICGSESPVIRSICVLGRGYWFLTDNGWQAWSRTYPLAEVVHFIAGVMNTYRLVAATRKKPRLGYYLIND